MNTTKPLGVGDRVPDFTLADQAGIPRSLSSLCDRRPAVVFFYPRDGTPICTAEACAFRDEFAAFRDLDAVVIGVSADSPERHAAFAQRHNLPFTLLSDPGEHAREAFGAAKTLGLFPARATYVINRDGIITKVFRSQLQSARHVREALAALKK